MYSPHLADEASDFYRNYIVEKVKFSIFVAGNFVWTFSGW